MDISERSVSNSGYIYLEVSTSINAEKISTVFHGRLYTGQSKQMIHLEDPKLVMKTFNQFSIVQVHHTLYSM